MARRALLLSALLWEVVVGAEQEDYILPVDPTYQPLHRLVGRPDGSLWRLVLLNRGKAVRAFELDRESGALLAEEDVSEPAFQAELVATERAIHGVEDWPTTGFPAAEARHKLWRVGRNPAPKCSVPDDTHLEQSSVEMYSTAFIEANNVPERTGRLLQVGGLYDTVEGDPARLLLQKHGLRGLVLASEVLPDSPEGHWLQGPTHVEASVEGGAAVLEQVRRSGWSEVDVVRLEDLPGACFLLQGLLAAGLEAGMVVTIVNGQFPPPIRFASMPRPAGQEASAALYGCSLSHLVDVLRPYGFHLVRYSGPYAAFLHSRRLVDGTGPADPDEFACYRGSRIWGFTRELPIEAVRDWFFSESPAHELWRRCQQNVSRVQSSGDAAFQLRL